jgi:hypothetical protein
MLEEEKMYAGFILIDLKMDGVDHNFEVVDSISSYL